jgi:plastocyanin
MRGRFAIVFSLALSLGLITAACAQEDPAIQSGGGGGDHSDQGEGHEDMGKKEIAGEQATYHGTQDVSGSSDFEVELDDYYFGPTILDGDPGQTLTLALHNEGGLNHTFTIDEAMIDEELGTGTSGLTVDVTFPDSGALVFYCRFHRDSGMLGALSVDGSLDAGSASSSGTMGSGSSGYDYG